MGIACASLRTESIFIDEKTAYQSNFVKQTNLIKKVTY